MKRTDTINEIFNSLEIATWVYSIQNKRIEYVSPWFARLFETEPKEIYKTNSLRPYIHPEDYDRVIKSGRNTLDKGKYDIQYRIIPGSRKMKWIQDAASVVKDENGKAIKIIGLSRDITSLKKEETKLIESEREKDTLLKAIPDSFFIVGRDGLIKKSFVKRHDLVLIRPRIRFIEGKHFQQVFVDALADHAERSLSGSYQNVDGTLSAEVEVQLKNGARYYELKVSALSESNVLIHLKDVTVNKANIIRLQKLFNITESTTELIVITDSYGKIEYVNPEFTKVTGYGFAEVYGHTFEFLRSGKHNKTYYKKMWKALNAKKIFQGIFINKKRNGELFAEEKIITPIISINGEITNFISSGRNITDQLKDKKEGLSVKKAIKRPKSVHKHQGFGSLILKQEIEKRNVAVELHEGLGQVLSATLMNLESIDFENLLQTKERQKIGFVNQSLHLVLNELRGLSTNLSPGGLYAFGLHSAVNQLVTELNRINRPFRYTFSSNISKLRFRNEIEINFFRIIQEALANFRLHSNGTICEVKLNSVSGKELYLEIFDNGIGIDLLKLNRIKKKKLGLLTMEERAKSIGAHVKIRSAPERGFKISIKVKIKPLK